MYVMIARDRDTFFEMYATLAMAILQAEPFDRGEVHAQKTTTPEMVTREITDRVLQFDIYDRRGVEGWQQMIEPNLPWAEDHFQERVSGVPLNPPPSEAYWPYAQAGNAAHKSGEKFSHSYPERFWPKFAEVPELKPQNGGIRFRYGDLSDLVEILKVNPRSRQANLPVWFPEDLAASLQGARVPCTLGYHFLLQADGYLHMSYYMRSCDLVRFFKDDVYMAGRLLQWVAERTKLPVGSLKMYVANLHAFEGDHSFLNNTAYGVIPTVNDPRASYNFGAMS